jgi:hypothetical protein
MRLTDNAWLAELVAEHESPCVSIYLPVYRAKPPAAQNPRLFRDAVDHAESVLARDYPARIARGLLEKIRSVPADPSFWLGERDALAIFAAPDFLRVMELQRSVSSAVHIGEAFNIKPLIRVFQSAWNYHLLTLTTRKVQMYLGTGDLRLDPLDSSRLPQSAEVVSKMRLRSDITADDDLHTPDTEYPDEGHSPRPVLLETFIRAVDKAVWEDFSRDAKLPLILCAAERDHRLFHDISRNPNLLKEGIKLDPHDMSRERLKAEAWAILEPKFRAEVERLKDRFMVAKAHQRGSDDLARVAEAAATGRVDTLLVDASRQIPGHLDRASRRAVPARTKDPVAEDLLDDLAGEVLKTHGEVLVLPPEWMPSDVGLAAIYRY